ncbi:helix-turn-helix domain protein [Desulfurispirillum indicum S5]|uniref:Helix-turn-helix domain protein n=1 Tax=Desulfurispirillum indicum (strain ATCC BAA-1389 / DSM 22839 / S5) TaxID=653733 RepID=E6W6B6_DESIS|nr:helix-turn-helix domain-containing protein [Desulfurispirillum indicum]ADU66152.1 helix-turn-helix domain protein [Desulfurispirillum indicum S5]
MSEISRRMKELREGLNLNQVKFAKLLGTSNTIISDIERGSRNPTIDLLIKIANTVEGTDLHWILTGKRSPANQQIDSDNASIEELLAGSLRIDPASAKLLLSSLKEGPKQQLALLFLKALNGDTSAMAEVSGAMKAMEALLLSSLRK